MYTRKAKRQIRKKKENIAIYYINTSLYNKYNNTFYLKGK